MPNTQLSEFSEHEICESSGEMDACAEDMYVKSSSTDAVLTTAMPMQEHCCLGLLPGDQRRLQEAKEERKYRLLLEDVQS